MLCLAHVGCGQLCSWVTSNLTWAAGARLELSISNIQQVCVLVLVITHLGGASRPGENLFQDLIDNTSLLKKACDFAYDRLLQPQKSMMMMAVVLY